MGRFLLVCLGGAVGTGARFLISMGAVRTFGTGFPVGTLVVNLLGCFVMGLLMQVVVQTTALSPTVQLTLTTGFLGGLTTYSSFNQELTNLFRTGAWGLGLLYFVVTLIGCLGLGILGAWVARSFV